MSQWVVSLMEAWYPRIETIVACFGSTHVSDCTNNKAGYTELDPPKHLYKRRHYRRTDGLKRPAYREVSIQKTISFLNKKEITQK